MKQPIKLFIAGGTVDKQYHEKTGLLGFDKSNIPEMLKQARSQLFIDVEQLMMIDSLDMTEEQRETIVRRCVEVPEDHIVITHGTDTMTKTGRLIQQTVKDKVIILTGAIRPFAFGSSDGFFNIGCTLAFVQTAKPGVYIVMNGKLFPTDKVEKNTETGIFETID